MSLVEKINEDMKSAMKNKDKDRLKVIRMLKSAITLAKIDLKHDLEDEEVIDIVSKQIKLRKDSIHEFEKANRIDLMEEYQAEITILNEYMPEQLSNDKVEEIIDEIFQKIQPTSGKQMGLIMKEITPKIRGKFDIGEASKIVREKLNKLL